MSHSTRRDKAGEESDNVASKKSGAGGRVLMPSETPTLQTDAKGLSTGVSVHASINATRRRTNTTDNQFAPVDNIFADSVISSLNALSKTLQKSVSELSTLSASTCSIRSIVRYLARSTGPFTSGDPNYDAVPLCICLLYCFMITLQSSAIRFIY